MTEGLPIYFPGDLYHKSKVGLKGVMDSFNIEWNPDEKAWISNCCRVVGTFEGHKKPALLYVSGSDAFIGQIREFADSVGAEIRESELPDVKDIRTKRKEESDTKRIDEERLKVEEDRAKVNELNRKTDSELSLLHAIENKVYRMTRMRIRNESIIKLIRLEMGVDIVLEPEIAIIGFVIPSPVVKKELPQEQGVFVEVKKVARKKFEKKIDISTKPSYLCEKDMHKDCGGFGCSCSCHVSVA